jgi:hypothetical protein
MPAYRKQAQASRANLGREMPLQYPFFCDSCGRPPESGPTGDAQIALNVMVELLAEAGLDAEVLYAVKRTGGLFPTAAHVLPAGERREWNTAIKEYRVLLLQARKQ